MTVKGPLIQTPGAPHLCIACGKEHAGCCGACPEYDPRDFSQPVPCPTHCSHQVCADARAKAAAAKPEELTGL